MAEVATEATNGIIADGEVKQTIIATIVVEIGTLTLDSSLISFTRRVP